MDQSIKTVRDIKINIRPVLITLVHEYSFEGPCRFGLTEEALSTEFDEIAAASSNKKFLQGLNDNLPSDIVNIMDPVIVDRHEDFLINERYIEALRKDDDQTDIFWISKGGFESVLEYFDRYQTNIAVVCMKPCCTNFAVTATFRARGIEAYGWANWEEAIQRIRVMRARKALRNTKVLLSPREDSTHSLTVIDGFLNLEEVTRKLGIRFRYLNVHELLDQTERIPQDANHTLPGKRMYNITDEDDAEIETITDKLISSSDACTMSRDMVKRSVDAYYVIQKLLRVYQCNAFTMPCADVCATRRYNEEKFTMCLNHSLNNEQGICSACEYDVPAIVSMVMLSALSNSAPYMGNTSYATPVKNGNELTGLVNAGDVVKMKDAINEGNVFYTFHAVPNRKLHGFDAPQSNFEIQPFAAVQKFGATIRYDFNKDSGQVITMCRVDPTCSKIVIGRGIIIGGIGYKSVNCSEGVFFSVKDPKKFREGCDWAGIHVPLVYGDYYDEMIMLAKNLGFEVFCSE